MLKLDRPIFLHFPASTSFSRAPQVSAKAGALESKIARLLSSYGENMIDTSIIEINKVIENRKRRSKRKSNLNTAPILHNYEKIGTNTPTTGKRVPLPGSVAMGQ